MRDLSLARQQLARRLRKLREERWPERHLTQKSLAQALGVSVATVSSWENPNNEALPPDDRLLGYARFFAGGPPASGSPRLPVLEELPDEARQEYEALKGELLGLRAAALGPPRDEEIEIARTWRFGDSGPATIVCAQLPEEEAGALADPLDPNYTELFSLADLDALLELHGHLRAENPDMNVFYKASENVAPDDLSGHLILLGGVGWNAITKRVLNRLELPVVQVPDPAVETGEIFVVKAGAKPRVYLPTWSDDNPRELIEDVGLLVRRPNPMNSSKTLTICNGIHSRGVYGAVRTLTDAQLRDQNERYLAKRFGPRSFFGILMRVQVVSGRTMTPDFNNSDTVLYEWHES
jgi:transcriptional regulator with XRE-family HTH domain